MPPTKNLDLTKSPLTREEVEKLKPKLDLKPVEETYMGNLKSRLMRAKNTRDTNNDFFDGQTYIQRCEQNRKFANMYIKPKANREDTHFTTGSARAKLIALLSAINNMNLKVDITVFDEKDTVQAALGESMEDIVHKTEEIDNDAEKRLIRQYTLLSQGEVFVEDMWKTEFRTEKSMPKFDGKFKGVNWTSRLEKVFEKASRNIIKNEKVYLGDISQPDFKKQPFVYTLEIQPYDRVRAIYGKWENFKFVQEKIVHFSDTQDHNTTQYNPFWTLSTVQEGNVEIVKYQDPINNEFQIILNGIPMLPIGFPLPWKYGGYNMVQQILEVMDSHYAYGKGLMQRLKTAAGLEDEFWRLALLKDQQQYKPPMANNTGRVLSSRVTSPGYMNYGIPSEKLKPLIDTPGVSQANFNILSLLRSNIDEHSVSPTFQGQPTKGEQTATEILELQKQSQIVLGLAVDACATLEQKLTELRVFILLEKWFDPLSKSIDKVRGSFRRTNVEKSIPGEGVGQQIIEVVRDEEQIPSPLNQLKEEERISRETGVPTRISFLNRKQILSSKLKWRYTVSPTPKQTSSLQKLMFKEQLQAFAFSGNLNMDWAEERAASVWNENPAKVFKKGNPVLPEGVAPESPIDTGKRTPLSDQTTRVTRKNTPSSTPAKLAAS